MILCPTIIQKKYTAVKRKQRKTYITSMGNLFKNRRTRGTETENVMISAIGCDAWIPMRSKNIGRISTRGMKQRPLRSAERTADFPASPVL